MKVLHIVGGLPTERKPYYQPFIKSQIDSLIKEGIEVEILEIKGHESLINYIKSITRLKTLLKNKKIDIIHAHYSYSGLVAYFAKVNTPIVLSLMGSDLLGRPDTKGNLTIHGRLDTKITNFISNHVDHVIVKSEQMRNHVNTSVPISVIPNGVDLNTFKPADILQARKELSLNSEDFIILFLGDPQNPRKNFRLAKTSVELFCKKVGEQNVKFLFPYGIDQLQILKYMNASDVLLLTSYWEGSPNIIKEAMACNLPIISTNVGDIAEVIDNTYNCFKVDFSEAEIADKLIRIKGNKQRSNGREKIGHLEISQIASLIIKIYTNLLHKQELTSEYIL